jgi:uncharacterized surface anchored protein
MSISSIGRSRVLAFGVLAAFILLVAPVGPVAQAQAATASRGSLSGFIYAKDMKSPVSGAVVKVRNLKDLKELASLPTDANGRYTIGDIPEGRYILGVTSAEEDFNLEYTLYVKDGELAKLSVSLAPMQQEKPGEAPTKRKGFFETFAGRALVVAAIGVGLYFLIVPEKEASPTIR